MPQDNLLLASCVIQGVLNAVLLWQVGLELTLDNTQSCTVFSFDTPLAVT
jgi:hypothetical protein